MYMKPFHSRNDSGELDVFEASRYFAGAAELSNGVNLTSSHKGCDQKPRFWRTGGPRMSLDMPNMRSGTSIPSSSLNGHHHLIMENKQSTMVVNVNKEKKHNKQQPSSPGGKLASFLNSLFNQTSSSKKKKSSMKDNDECPGGGGGGGGRRKRRSSISHTTTTTNHHHHQKDDTKSANTPIKVITIPSKIMMKPSTAADHYAWLDDNKFQWDRKHRIFANGYSDQKENIVIKKNQLLSQVDHHDDQKHDDDDDDGMDEDGRRNSDSSSDLFELQNYNLGYDSCGLPVYETTNMASIKISALPISSGAK